MAGGDPKETTVKTEMAWVKKGAQEDTEGMTEKMKARVKAVGEKMFHPDKDLRSEYEQKKVEERVK